MARPLGGEIYVSIKVTAPHIPRLLRPLWTTANRLLRHRKVERALTRTAPEVKNWTSGTLERGYSGGQAEPSFAVKLYGLDSHRLDRIARELAAEFKQFSVLVVDLGGGETRLVSGPLGESRT